MKTKKRAAKPSPHRGRRRFNTKFDKPFDSFKQPHPYGEKVPLQHIAGRPALLKFFQPKQERLSPAAKNLLLGVPLTFEQVADWLLGEKQKTMHNAALAKQLDSYTERNATNHVWNDEELPPELLHDALSKCAKFALTYPVVQRALKRLYAVAWFGHGDDSVQAKMQLAKLIPAGRAYPVTKWIPELAGLFREMRSWILQSDELMRQEFPDQVDRVNKLAELYGEHTEVINDALQSAERPFLTARLSAVLALPLDTVKKALAKSLPAS